MTGIEEILISAVAQAVIAIAAEDLAQRPGLAGLREKLQGDSPEKLALQRAIARALSTFAQAHPRYVESLFDEHFLNTPAVHQELAKLLTRHKFPDKKQLSELWKQQIGGKITGSIDEPLTFFLDALTSEIKSQTSLGDIVDGRNLEQILQRQDDVVAQLGRLNETNSAMLDLMKQRAFWKADAEQEVLPRPGATSAILAQDPDDLTEKPRKLFGRDDLLRDVRILLDAGERVLLQGFGGMGKTALAATIAADWIRDGKGVALWLKTGSAPTDALMEALARPLNAAQLIARETGDAKTSAMRSILRQSGVKVLVLDDCWNGAALFALLKAVPSEMPVLLTARQRYSIEGKIRDVGELSRADSLRLLTYHADLDRPDLAPSTLHLAPELCDLLGDHAFAIEIAGKVLKAQKWTPEKLLNDIRSAPHTLTLPLEFAEPGRENVAKLLETSLNALDDETRAVFRAFGAFFAPALTAEMLMRYFVGKPKVSDEMLAGTRVDVSDVADLSDDDLRMVIQIALSQNIDSTPVEKALTNLELHGLVESISAADNAHAHYRLHDLAYSYASAQNTEAEHHHALDACLAYLERYAEPNLANFAALRPELDNLLKAADWAFQIGRYTDVNTFSQSLYFGNDSSWGFLAMQGFSSLALGLLSQAVEAATRQGDKQNQGIHLGNLGSAYGNLGKFKHALECFEQALKINREMDDKQNEGGTLGNLGLIYSNLGEAERAIGYLEQSLAINREVGDKHSESNQLGNLGSIYYSLRQVQRAIEYYEEALVISREISNKRAEGIWLGNLGVVYRSLGQPERAMEYYQQSITIRRAIGDRMGEADDLTNIGNLHGDWGDYPQAISYFEQARAVYSEIGATHRVTLVDGNLALARAKMAGDSGSPEP